MLQIFFWVFKFFYSLIINKRSNLVQKRYLVVSDDEWNLIEFSGLDEIPRIFRKKGICIEIVNVRFESQREEFDSSVEQGLRLNLGRVNLEEIELDSNRIRDCGSVLFVMIITYYRLIPKCLNEIRYVHKETNV